MVKRFLLALALIIAIPSPVLAVQCTGGKFVNGINPQSCATPPGGGGGTSVVSPGGRLTLTSNTPVMTADATAQTTIYYDTYIFNNVPVAGTSLTITGDQISVILDTTNDLSGKLYDIFAINVSAAPVLCTGPAWTSTSARGSGAGTTELQLSNGVWTNKNSLTHCWNNAVDKGPIGANAGTYLGTFDATANGQTGMQFHPAAAAGGSLSSTTCALCLYNAYNRVVTYSTSLDSTASWTYTSQVWRAADNNNNNRVTFVDGLAVNYYEATARCLIGTSVNSIAGEIGIDLNSTSNTPQITAYVNTQDANDTLMDDTWTPVLGLNFLQAVEWSIGATTTFFGTGGSGNGNHQAIIAKVWM